MDIREKEEIADNTSIVCEFEDVFPKELNEIDFEIELFLDPNLFPKPILYGPNIT